MTEQKSGNEEIAKANKHLDLFLKDLHLHIKDTSDAGYICSLIRQKVEIDTLQALQAKDATIERLEKRCEMLERGTTGIYGVHVERIKSLESELAELRDVYAREVESSHDLVEDKSRLESALRKFKLAKQRIASKSWDGVDENDRLLMEEADSMAALEGKE